MKTLIFKVLYFLKMCPIFVGSVHNFGKSEDYLVKKYLFPIDALVVWCPTWSKNLGWTLTWKFQLDVVAKGMSRHLNVFLQLMKQILINLSQKSRLNWQDDWPPKKQDRKNSLIYWKRNRLFKFWEILKSLWNLDNF